MGKYRANQSTNKRDWREIGRDEAASPSNHLGSWWIKEQAKWRKTANWRIKEKNRTKTEGNIKTNKWKSERSRNPLIQEICPVCLNGQS